jgi:DNA mismatch endonuclease, patch repair protein
MADIVTAEVRSRMMSGIRGKDTRPEMLLRKALHAAGFRFRLHDRRLPGKPDIVLPRWRAVILVHGCFWHGHDCHLFKVPSSRTGFWLEKIEGNRQRDSHASERLLAGGWRVATVWECSLKGRTRQPFEDLMAQLVRWLTGPETQLELTGVAC